MALAASAPQSWQVLQPRLRVLLCTNSTLRGGAEEHMLVLLRGLDPEAFDLHLACPRALLRQLPDLPATVQVHANAPRAPWHLAAGLRLLGYARRHRIEVAHLHLACSSRAAAPWLRLAGVAAIVETPHVREAWRQGWKAFYWLDRLCGRLVDAYIAVGAANARYLQGDKGLPAPKIWTICNGIDLSRFQRRPPADADPRRAHGIPPGDLLIVCAARLEPQKGHSILLQAFATLISGLGPNLRLVCLGEGSLEAALRDQAARLGLQDHVTFAGFTAHMEAWLATADIFVLPSLYEGLPLAAIEAAAAGCPIVATNVDGTPEVVEDGCNGVLVAPNDPVALAQALQRLIADPALRLRLGQNGQNLAARFDQQRQIASTASLYLALGRSRTRARAALEASVRERLAAAGVHHG